MAIAPKPPEPVTIEAFDAFVQSKGDDARLYELNDRGAKLDFYKVVPTMGHLVLVYQDQMRVEHYRRTPVGFELEVLKKPEDRLEFDSLGFEIDLASVYFGVEV